MALCTYGRVSAFVHVHLRAGHGYDLLGVTIKNCDKKSLKEISSELEQDVKRLRLGKNKPMENAKLILQKIPPFLYKSVIRFFDFLMYTLNIDCSFIGMPKDAYGSFAVSAIGSLGFEEAYLPLFPFSRLPLIMGIGKPYKKWCYDGKKQILKTFMVLTFTMDHRYYDGAHFAKPIRFFKKVVADPVKYGVFISK